MKAVGSLLFLAACAAAQLSSVHTVYLLPMSNGMDQYLANRLTQTGTFQVVTDPKRADAVFTDRVGESFEQRMEALYPPEPKPKPEPPKEAKKEAAPKDASKKDDVKKDEAKKPEEDKPPAISDAIEAGPARSSAFSRAPGNVFLVDVRTRNVLWSTYARPKRISPDELTGTAKTVIDRLAKTLAGKR